MFSPAAKKMMQTKKVSAERKESVLPRPCRVNSCHTALICAMPCSPCHVHTETETDVETCLDRKRGREMATDRVRERERGLCNRDWERLRGNEPELESERERESRENTLIKNSWLFRYD